MSSKHSKTLVPSKAPPSVIPSGAGRGGTPGLHAKGVDRYRDTFKRLASVFGDAQTKAQIKRAAAADDDEDDDDEEDEDFDPEGSDDDDEDGDDSTDDDDYEDVEGDDDDDDDGDGDSEADDETRGEQAQEVTREELREERRRAKKMAQEEIVFKRKSQREELGEDEEHVLIDEHGNEIEEEDEEEEEETDYAEDRGPEMRQIIAGAWRMQVAKHGVLQLRAAMKREVKGVLNKEERRRIVAAMTSHTELQAALGDLREQLIDNMVRETAPAMKRLSSLIRESLGHKSVIVLPVADMLGVMPPSNGDACSVTGVKIVEGAGYFLEFNGAKNAAGTPYIKRVMLTKKAASAVMAVNYLMRIMDAMAYHAACLVESAAIAAGGATKVDSSKFLEEHCLIDAKGVVDYYYNTFMRQLVFIKGIVYKGIELPPLLQRAYNFSLAESKKKK